MRYFGLQGQNDAQTKKLPFQFVCHAEISGRRPLICASTSSGPTDIACHVIINLQWWPYWRSCSSRVRQHRSSFFISNVSGGQFNHKNKVEK